MQSSQYGKVPMSASCRARGFAIIVWIMGSLANSGCRLSAPIPVAGKIKDDGQRIVPSWVQTSMIDMGMRQLFSDTPDTTMGDYRKFRFIITRVPDVLESEYSLVYVLQMQFPLQIIDMIDTEYEKARIIPIMEMFLVRANRNGTEKAICLQKKSRVLSIEEVSKWSDLLYRNEIFSLPRYRPDTTEDGTRYVSIGYTLYYFEKSDSVTVCLARRSSMLGDGVRTLIDQISDAFMEEMKVDIGK